MQPTSLQIAAASMRDQIPADKSLTERLQFAMRYVRRHGDSLFWMEGRVNDDDRLRTALAAVMLAGSEEDKDAITRSLKPLQALSAAMSGIPVDFDAMGWDDDLIPLVGLWHESAEYNEY
jgi:hypothetical protein